MRTFIALSLPLEALATIEEAVTTLREALPLISWTDPKDRHLTLAFLGDQQAAGIDAATRALHSLAAMPAPPLRLTGLSTFPANSEGPSRHWRVLVVACALEPRLILLHRLVNEVLLREFAMVGKSVPNKDWGDGIRPPRRAFAPHLTLARASRGGASPRLDPEALEKAGRMVAAAAPRAGWPSETLTLYASEPGPGGIRYRPLSTLSFAGDQ